MAHQAEAILVIALIITAVIAAHWQQVIKFMIALVITGVILVIAGGAIMIYIWQHAHHVVM